MNTTASGFETFIGLAIFAAVILVPVGAFWLSLVWGDRRDKRR